MKRSILTSLTIIAGIIFTTSCGMKKENEALVQKNDSLQAMLTQQQTMLDNQTSEINDYVSFIADIQQSIDAISHKQKELTSESTEQSVVTDSQKRAQLKEQINDLHEQIQANKRKVDKLANELSKSQKSNKQLNAMIANLQTQIDQKDKDLEELRKVIDKQNTQIEGLKKDVNEKTQQIKDLEGTVSQQTETINTAWYYVATKTDLRNKGIIDKKGKIITNSDENFTKIDITKTTTIPINSAKKIIILSAHPLNSYEVIYDNNKKITSVKINNAKSFWSLSNRFVAIIK